MLFEASKIVCPFQKFFQESCQTTAEMVPFVFQVDLFVLRFVAVAAFPLIPIPQVPVAFVPSVFAGVYHNAFCFPLNVFQSATLKIPGANQFATTAFVKFPQ